MSVSIVLLGRLFLTAVLLMLMALAAWGRHRRAPEAPVLALLLVSAAIYCFGYGGEIAQTTLSGAVFWLHIEYLGIPWIPALWVLLARRHNKLHTRLVPLFALPVLTFIGELTNSFHHLYDRSMTLVPRGPFWVVTVDRGPIAWLNLAFLFGALFYGAWVYISRFRTSSRLYRFQAFTLIASALIPGGGYFIYMCGWSPWGLDLAPLTLGLSAILAYLAVFHFGSFDLVPMARSLVFNSIRDAALVTDLRHRLVDFNPVARALLPGLAVAKVGDDLARVLRESPALAGVLSGPGGLREIELSVDGELHHFEVRFLPLGEEEHQFGWAIIFADITAQRRLVHELRRDAETDELTGMANRRRFVSAIERENSRAVRHGASFSVILADVDHFKDINDGFGHAAGDKVLNIAADRIAQCLRGADLLSRYGGDEFAILLPETGSEGALEVAGRIRAAVASDPVDVDGQAIKVTSSIGLATHDPAHTVDWEQLLEQADQALYRAKADGRNKVAAWDGPTLLARQLEASGEGPLPE